MERVDKLETVASSLKSDVEELKSDVSVIRREVVDINREFEGLNKTVETLATKEDVQEIRNTLGRVEQAISEALRQGLE